MKTSISILIAFLLLITGCTVASSEKDNKDNNKTYGLFEFDKDLYDFGVIKSGDTVYHDFKFTNTGQAPLIICNVAAQCGCTKIEWPKEAIKPQEIAKIRVGFTKTEPAVYQKTIVINANTKEIYYLLHIIAEIKSGT